MIGKRINRVTNYNKAKRSALAASKRTASFFLLITFFFSCSFSSKDESSQPDQPGWTVTVKGKVGFPQKGQIMIQEITNNGVGWQDTVSLKQNYTFSKRVKLTQPGYYKINFYGRQFVDFILYKSDIEINVDGNDPNGFAEVKGSPEIEFIKKTQLMLREAESTPEMAQTKCRFHGGFPRAQSGKDGGNTGYLHEGNQEGAGQSRRAYPR